MFQKRKGYVLALVLVVVALGVLVAGCGQNQPQPAETEKAQPTVYPPVITHSLEGRVGQCLVCHEEGSGVDAPKTSHPERANCQQCHVAQGAEQQ
ncbi:hypothetical protein [Calderihabitans maritimus]|uniref:Periplasmic nitrate reductase, small subunit napB n=1 Tax=Calderihabitans maritimus TaxID=1246530 RepID=A0A1Z5HX04_9FIRM|nr:hypothetical protein [Calderihabitans maritimus]GAW94044.1 periplasmic nitrate reductase, small subunit napB [Calderihabitans maritimus]